MFGWGAVTVLCAKYPKAIELNLKGCPCVDEVLVQQAMLSLRLVVFSAQLFKIVIILSLNLSMKNFETIWLENIVKPLREDS